MNPTLQTEKVSVLATLRRLLPDRQLRLNEALKIAEQQASRLRQLLDVQSESMPLEALYELPRVRVQYRDLPTSGMSYWNGDAWIIAINRSEPSVRQRFTIFHELKHIIDHGCERYADDAHAEVAADFFAGCVLVPRLWLKRAWTDLVQRPEVLARLFDVSARAMNVRLAQVGLQDDPERCPRRIGTRGRS